MLSILCAIARDGAIGMTRDGVPGLPWPRLRQDRAWFRGLTQCEDPASLARAWCAYVPQVGFFSAARPNTVIIGKRTWQSLASRPLPHRHNIVLVPYADYGTPGYEGAMQCCALETAIAEARVAYESPHTFVIGGARPFAEALQHPDLETLFLTEIDQSFPDADTHWPGYYDWYAGILAEDAEQTGWQYHRAAVSPWITEAECPRYRLGIWSRER